MTLAVAIAVVSAAALVVFAARQAPAGERRVTRMSRASINAAEERAIWAPPKITSSADPGVTMTGCLEKHGDGFRLTDTSGEEAPKARSWKSMFLKKATASVDLVDAAHLTTPAKHVGERVRVTGALDDRRMQLRSLTRIADSCR